MRIAITGIGIVSAIGNNCAETLQSLLEQRSGIGPMRYLHSVHTEYPVGEVQLSKYFMAFGGAKYTWTAAEYNNNELGDEKTKEISTVTNGTTVNLGARFDYGPAAIELAFTKQFLANPFSGFAEKDAIVTSLGAFIFF